MRDIIISVISGLFLIASAACNRRSNEDQELFASAAGETDIVIDTTGLIPVEPTTLYYYPCNDCHSEQEPNPQRRELVDMHDDIVFDHDSENRWCLACHDMNQRDSLRLADGRLLGFNESYKLCGQCHGPKYRDWRIGIHGRRTGEWNGEKHYLLCVHCHDPHSPRFKSLEPLPPPERPEEINIDSIYERTEKDTASL